MGIKEILILAAAFVTVAGGIIAVTKAGRRWIKKSGSQSLAVSLDCQKRRFELSQEIEVPGGLPDQYMVSQLCT